MGTEGTRARLFTVRGDSLCLHLLARHGLMPFLALSTRVFNIFLGLRAMLSRFPHGGVPVRAAKVALYKRLLLLCALLDLGGDTAVLGGGKLVENCSQFVCLIDVAEQDLLIDILGTRSQCFFLQVSDRGHSITPGLFAEAEFAG